MLRMIIRRWKLLVPVLCLYVVLLGYFANRTRTLARANEGFAANLAAAAPPSTGSGKLTQLQKEQERLKSDIEAILQLKGTLSKLTNEVAAAERKSSEVWLARANEVQSAIEQERKALQETIQWSRDWERMKIREAAEKRLAEKATLNLDPSKEYERTGKIVDGTVEWSEK